MASGEKICQALNVLGRNSDPSEGFMTMRELSDELGTSPRSARRIVNQLEEHGLVRRKRNGGSFEVLPTAPNVDEGGTEPVREEGSEFEHPWN